MSARKKAGFKGKAGSRAGGAGPEGTAAEPTFEEALERLEGLVERLEEGKVPLEESLAAYAEGTRLVKLCLERLERAELLIRELSESTGGFALKASTLEKDVEDEDGEEPDSDQEDDADEFQP